MDNTLGGYLSFADYGEVARSVSLDSAFLLRATNENEAKAEFMASSRLVRPRYIYQSISALNLKQKQTTIRETLSLLSKDKNLTDKQAEDLRIRLGQYYYECELILAARAFNRSSSKTERELQEKRFQRANEAIYGKFHADTFWSLLRERLAMIPMGHLSQEEQMQYAEMMRMIGVIGRNRKKRFAPQPKTVKAFGKRVQELFASILRHIPDDKEVFTPEDAAKITNEIIEQEIGIWDAASKRGTKYRAVVDKTRSMAAVNNGQQRILYPGKRSAGNYSRIELEKIIVHEFGVHVMRALPAEHQDLRAFYDNSSYSRLTEEGLAKVCEQALDGKYDDIGIIRYITIGLVTVCKKTFRETYEILWRMEKLLNGRSQTECFDFVQRATRGTGVLPINADLSYYRGVNLVWKYIEEHLDDVGLMQVMFLSGKTDFLNQDRKRLIKTMQEDNLT